MQDISFFFYDILFTDAIFFWLFPLATFNISNMISCTKFSDFLSCIIFSSFIQQEKQVLQLILIIFMVKNFDYILLFLWQKETLKARYSTAIRSWSWHIKLENFLKTNCTKTVIIPQLSLIFHLDYWIFVKQYLFFLLIPLLQLFIAKLTNLMVHSLPLMVQVFQDNWI